MKIKLWKVNININFENMANFMNNFRTLVIATIALFVSIFLLWLTGNLLWQIAVFFKRVIFSNPW